MTGYMNKLLWRYNHEAHSTTAQKLAPVLYGIPTNKALTATFLNLFEIKRN